MCPKCGNKQTYILYEHWYPLSGVNATMIGCPKCKFEWTIYPKSSLTGKKYWMRQAILYGDNFIYMDDLIEQTQQPFSD